MAKITFSKLGLKKIGAINTVNVGDSIVEVKQYLPINEKTDLISRVVIGAHDKNFANPIKVEVLGNMEIVMAYSNITFTEKQKEELDKTYDLLVESKVLDIIINAIPTEEYNFIVNGINETIKAVYGYENSVLGILESIQTDYSNLNLDATEIQEKLADPDNMKLLKSVVTKLG